MVERPGPPLVYYRTAERPDLSFWLLDDDGALLNLSTGYTFVFKLGIPGSAATLTKSSGITGAAGAGVEPTGTPNCTVSLSAGDLDNVAAGTMRWQLRATTGGVDRVYQGIFELRDVIT